MITQTAPQALAFRRSRRQSSWTSSKGQLKREQEPKNGHADFDYCYQKHGKDCFQWGHLVLPKLLCIL